MGDINQPGAINQPKRHKKICSDSILQAWLGKLLQFANRNMAI
jgi:hypothetical protein